MDFFTVTEDEYQFCQGSVLWRCCQVLAKPIIQIALWLFFLDDTEKINHANYTAIASNRYMIVYIYNVIKIKVLRRSWVNLNIIVDSFADKVRIKRAQ